MEQGRTLEYYLLKSGDLLEYRKSISPLRVKTMDGSVRTLLVDHSQNAGELVKVACAKIGKTNNYELITH